MTIASRVYCTLVVFLGHISVDLDSSVDALEHVAARVVQLEVHSFHNRRVASSNPTRVISRFFFWQGRSMHMPVNTAVRAVVRSPGKAVPLGVLCLRVGAFTFHALDLMP